MKTRCMKPHVLLQIINYIQKKRGKIQMNFYQFSSQNSIDNIFLLGGQSEMLNNQNISVAIDAQISNEARQLQQNYVPSLNAENIMAQQIQVQQMHLFEASESPKVRIKWDEFKIKKLCKFYIMYLNCYPLEFQLIFSKQNGKKPEGFFNKAAQYMNSKFETRIFTRNSIRSKEQNIQKQLKKSNSTLYEFMIKELESQGQDYQSCTILKARKDHYKRLQQLQKIRKKGLQKLNKI